MKYIKKYEGNNDDIKINDFIIVKGYKFRDEKWEKYINNNVGVFIKKIKKEQLNKKVDIYLTKFYINDYIYNTYFKYIKDRDLLELENNNKIIKMHLKKEHILYFSDNMNDIEIFKSANKYNL